MLDLPGGLVLNSLSRSITKVQSTRGIEWDLTGGTKSNIGRFIYSSAPPVETRKTHDHLVVKASHPRMDSRGQSFACRIHPVWI